MTKQIDEKTSTTICEIIGRHLDLTQYRLFLFGSRATGKASTFSDYDIGLEGAQPVPFDELLRIKNDLEDSDIVYNVDVVDFGRTSNSFKKIAKQAIIDIRRR